MIGSREELYSKNADICSCMCVCLQVHVSQNMLAEGMKNMVVNSTIRLFLGVF